MGEAKLPPSTLEINEVAAYLYAPAKATDACAWYVAALHRWVKAGAPIVIATVKASLAGELLHITYPQTGEQLARAAYERLLAQGVPKLALRFREEAGADG